MKKIIFITTPGRAKMEFVNTLHQQTGEGVALVIIQKPKKKPFFKRIHSFYKKVDFTGIIPEIYYFVRLKYDKQRREAIGLTKLMSPLPAQEDTYLPPILEVDDINSDEVYAKVLSMNAELTVIWGGLIIKPRLITATKRCINMHTGHCPYYRGTNCNLNAILNNDLDHIGITIHEVATKVDAGAVYAVIKVNTEVSPWIFFRELNNLAVHEYMRIAIALYKGEILDSTPQDITLGRNYLLKDWTYKKQYQVATKLLALDMGYRALKGKSTEMHRGSVGT